MSPQQSHSLVPIWAAGYTPPTLHQEPITKAEHQALSSRALLKPTTAQQPPFPYEQCPTTHMHWRTGIENHLHDLTSSGMLQVSSRTPSPPKLVLDHYDPLSQDCVGPTSIGMEDRDCRYNQPLQPSSNEDPYMEL